VREQIMQEASPGSRTTRTTWMDNILQWTGGLHIGQDTHCILETESSGDSSIVHGVAKPRDEDG